MSKNLDHKELGRKLDLFHFSPDSPGFVFWHPKGATLFNLVVDDLRTKLTEMGYQELKTPLIFNMQLFKASGHYDNYRDRMYFTGNEEQFKKGIERWVVKPMNCPGTLEIFKNDMRSYRDLPLKYLEFGICHRYEQAGELNGLFRVRELMIDDAHIFCMPDQIEKKVEILVDLIFETYRKYDFEDFSVELSTRPAKSIGTAQQWEKAEKALAAALKAKKIKYKENPGEGAFYGPKIDFHIKDSLGRSWQMGTIQLDFSMAERLDCNYIDEDGKKQVPAMIHQAIFGSVERFLGVLIEHFQGKFPVWLAPVQVLVASFSQDFQKEAAEVSDRLKKEGLRVELDNRNESVNRKVRDAEIQKIPYIIVIGKKEVESDTLAVRERDSNKVSQMKVEEFIEKVRNESKAK